MAKNLVDGNGFVYNIGQRATASSCPLYTLVIAAAYFVIRDMFFVSLLVNIVFSGVAFGILIRNFCKTKRQIIFCLLVLIGSASFVSYTTSGLENSMLFLLGAIFMKRYFSSERYNAKSMFILAILVALIAMTRMDAVLIFVPMALYVYLTKRDGVSFGKAVWIGVAGLLPFVLWEIFATWYYGFPFPNTAYAKLGTNIGIGDYIVRGIRYYLNAAVCDPIILIVPLFVMIAALSVKKSQYIACMAGPLLYGIYLLYIGGDFMMGRHFTLLFFISVICYMDIKNREFSELGRGASLHRMFTGFVIAALLFTGTSHIITDQFLFGNTFGSPISDERAGYFNTSSLFNNVYSLIKTGDLCIRNTWNEDSEQELRDNNMQGSILENVPGLITHKEGQTLQTIKDVLRDELHYTMDYMVLNSADFGVPQYRKRLYLIGFREDLPVYVDGEDSSNGNQISPDGRTRDGNFVFSFPKGKFCKDHVGIGRFVETSATGPSISKYLQKTYIFKAHDGHPEVIDENTGHPVKTLCASYHKIQRLTGTFVRGGETGLRLLTESECKYIMGFPQNYIVPVSRTSMYHQFGNSVAVPVIDALAKEMVKTMCKAEERR